MAVKETIAFIGGAGKTCPVLMKKMSEGNLRLLFVSNEEERITEFVEQLKAGRCEEAEVEVVHCVKDSCWEADLIAFVDPEAINEEVLEKIREVATQKIVLLITTEHNNNTSSFTCKSGDLKKDLPYSKVVTVMLDSREMSAKLIGEDTEALATVTSVMTKAGYETRLGEKE